MILKIARKKAETLLFTPVDQLTIKQLQDVVNEKGPTYYTAKDIKTLLTTLLNHAMAEQWVKINLAEFIVRPDLCRKSKCRISFIFIFRL